MPPAFNLSQDQTLQFNLLLSHFKVTSLQPLALKILTRFFFRSPYFLLRTFVYFFLSTNVHTYHLSLFKDRFASTSSQLPIERFVYHPLRNEIMPFSSLPVKNFFNFLSKAPDSLFTLRLPSALFCQGSVKAPDGRSGAFWDNCLTITYFHTGYSTIIGAISFHGPVRDGKGWFQLAMVIRHNWSVGRHQRPTQSGNQQEF